VPDEAIGDANHPIAPDDICHVLAGSIAGGGPTDSGVLSQDIVHPPFYHQPVLHEILADKRIPKEGRIVSSEGAGLFLPGIIAGYIQLQTGHGEPAQFEAMILGPIVCGEAWIDGTDGRVVIAIGVQPNAVVISDVFPDGKTAAGVIVVVVAQLIAYITDVAAGGCVEVCAQVNPGG